MVQQKSYEPALPELVQALQRKFKAEKERLAVAKAEESDQDEGFLWSGINFDDDSDNAEVRRKDAEELDRAERALCELIQTHA